MRAHKPRKPKELTLKTPAGGKHLYTSMEKAPGTARNKQKMAIRRDTDISGRPNLWRLAKRSAANGASKIAKSNPCKANSKNIRQTTAIAA